MRRRRAKAASFFAPGRIGGRDAHLPVRTNLRLALVPLLPGGAAASARAPGRRGPARRSRTARADV